MSTTSITRCDSCHKVIDYDGTHRIEINRFNIDGKKPYYYWDICDECIVNILAVLGLTWKKPAPSKRKKK
jgi:hypothetical protein